MSSGKGMDTLERFTSWMNQGMMGVESISALFRSCYGIKDHQMNLSDESSRLKKTVDDFMVSFREFLALLGVVPYPIHAALQQKCREQEDTIQEQKELISLLKQRLEEKNGFDLKTDSKSFKVLMENQADQFQKLMESVQEFLKHK